MNDNDRPSRARYGKVKTALDLKWRRRRPQQERMMREVVDALWDAFGGEPWTWCGLWLAGTAGLGPGPSRGAPGAEPAGPGPLAGEALSAGLPRLGEGAVAVPAFDAAGRAWAVLEARASSAFDGMDVRWLERLLKSFQLDEEER